MKTEMKNVAAIVACVIWVDEEYSDEEKECLEEIAEALEFKSEDFIAVVESELNKIKTLSDDEVNKYLLTAADAVDDEEVGIVLEVVIQVAICDNVLTSDQTEIIHIIAAALGISPAMTTLLVADMVREEDVEVIIE